MTPSSWKPSGRRPVRQAVATELPGHVAHEHVGVRLEPHQDVAVGHVDFGCHDLLGRVRPIEELHHGSAPVEVGRNEPPLEAGAVDG